MDQKAGLVKQPECEWPEQVNLIVASDEENIPSSVFMTQADKKKAVIQWERFSNFNRIVNTMAYVRRAFSKYKPATLLVSIEEIEKAKASILKLLQREQFGEEMKSPKIEQEIPKSRKTLQFSPYLDEEGLIRAKSRVGKSQLGFNINIQYCYIGNIMQLNCCCETSTRTINTNAQSMSETLFSRRCGS